MSEGIRISRCGDILFFVISILVTTGNAEVWATDQVKVHRQTEERQEGTPPVMASPSQHVHDVGMSLSRGAPAAASAGKSSL